MELESFSCLDRDCIVHVENNRKFAWVELDSLLGWNYTFYLEGTIQLACMEPYVVLRWDCKTTPDETVPSYSNW